MKTLIYYRVSTKKQPLDSQKLAVEQYCNARGWTDRLVFEDVGVSGARASRPGLDAALKLIRSGGASRLVCFKLDRVARSLTHLGLVVAELQSRGCALISVNDNIDTSNDNAAGRLQLHILAAVAEFERCLIRERVIAGVSAYREAKGTWGRPSLVSTWASDALSLRGQGLSIRAIAGRLGQSRAAVGKVLRGVPAPAIVGAPQSTSSPSCEFCGSIEHRVEDCPSAAKYVQAHSRKLQA